MMPIRAGGHIIRDTGWELEHPPGTAEESPKPQRPKAPSKPPADDQGPDKAECPDCGQEVRVKKDGTLRKHTCVIDAPPPHVTFDGPSEDEEEENNDG